MALLRSAYTSLRMLLENEGDGMYYFDGHCDTLLGICSTNQQLDQNNLHIDLMRTRELEQYSQIFAIWVDDCYEGETAWELVRKVYAYGIEQFRRHGVALCVNWQQYEQAEKERRPKALLALEGGHGLGGKPERVRQLYEMGFRIITLTWNGENDLACGQAGGDGGLKKTGKQVLSEMARCGMLADVSHLNDRGFWEAVESGCRIIATHSNSRAVCAHKRNLTDDQFRELMRQGTGTGINLYTPFVGERGSLDELIAHIDHFLALGGENHLFMGADWDGIDQSAAGMRGIEDVSALYEQLLKLNYNEGLLCKIFYSNLREIVRRTLQK